MKILVLSDSHSALSFMRHCIDSVKPDIVIHLGDYFRDAEAMTEEYPAIRFYQVPGNCDRRRLMEPVPEILTPEICGVRFFLTHGHLHGVKTFLDKLILDAFRSGAEIALFGHTHEAYCQKEPEGLWVMNPGSCGYYGGSAGFVRVEDGRILECRILREEDLGGFQ